MIALLAACPLSQASAAPVGAAQKAVSKAELIKPLSLTKDDDLEFGTIVSSALSGVVAIDAVSGKRTVTGGVTAAPSGAFHRATFQAIGQPAQTIVIVVVPPPALTNSTGDQVQLIALTLDGSPIRVIGSTGELDFGVGGAIVIDANQNEGTYQADFDVLVSYF